MVIVAIAFVPVFRRLKIFTAYEYLEQRFDIKTRLLTSFLFMLSRGLSTGISILAPSLVLHSMLGWDITITNLVMGGVLMIYTASGGAKAVGYTQQLQFVIIYIAMFLAAWWAIKMLPEGVGLTDALHIGGKSGKLNVITTGVTEEGNFDWKDRFNIWSGIIGGLFLALSYFGTDQSQVGRYLTARTEGESKLGLLMNGLVKVPLQFFILLIGVLVFSFYQFYKAPAFFNLSLEEKVKKTEYAPEYNSAVAKYDVLQEEKKQTTIALTKALHNEDQQTIDALREKIQVQDKATHQFRKEIEGLVKKAVPGADSNDTNYVFVRFVGDFFPDGLVGLIIAIIFLAAWGSVAAALNSLASCTMVDFHKRLSKKELSPEKEYKWSRYYTLLWGIFCIIVAQFAYNLGNSLIEAVNILGSWFYGAILGIFLVAFYLKHVKGHAVFIAALLTEVIVISIYNMDLFSWLWLNVIGAALVVILSLILQAMMPVFRRRKPL
jgi:Na+/proline symporter